MARRKKITKYKYLRSFHADISQLLALQLQQHVFNTAVRFALIVVAQDMAHVEQVGAPHPLQCDEQRLEKAGQPL